MPLSLVSPLCISPLPVARLYHVHREPFKLNLSQLERTCFRALVERLSIRLETRNLQLCVEDFFEGFQFLKAHRTSFKFDGLASSAAPKNPHPSAGHIFLLASMANMVTRHYVMVVSSSGA